MPQGTTPLAPALEQHPGNSAIARWLTQQSAQLATLAHPLTRSLTQTLAQAGPRLDHWRTETLAASGTGDPFQISLLIQAAVDYFLAAPPRERDRSPAKINLLT
ncbi:MAG: hypothetical protein HC890_11240 [Chloroflexaceae bacterium]|nr:hypothetical protein [Chloroflexaceae bacterium]